MEEVDEVKTIDREGSLFFQTHKNSIGDFTFYYKKFKCLKDQRMRI